MRWITNWRRRRAEAEWYDVRCSDGTVKRVYYDIDKAIPFFAKEWRRTMRLDLEGQVEAEYSTLVRHVLEQLHQEYHGLVLALRGAYLLYQGDPCNNEPDFKRALREIIASATAPRRIERARQEMAENIQRAKK